MNTDECIMYLVRHGATEANLARPARLQGRGLNLRLSEVGRRQAQATADFFAKRPIDAIFSSPMIRAMETAELVAQPHGHQVQTREELVEVHVGDWEERSWDDIVASEPEAYARFIEHPGTHGYPGGESFQDVQNRALPVLHELLQENMGRRLVVIAHNVVNRACLAGMLGLPINNARTIQQQNCGVNIVRWKAGEVQVRTMNATFHLDDT